MNLDGWGLVSGMNPLDFSLLRQAVRPLGQYLILQQLGKWQCKHKALLAAVLSNHVLLHMAAT